MSADLSDYDRLYRAASRLCAGRVDPRGVVGVAIRFRTFERAARFDEMVRILVRHHNFTHRSHGPAPDMTAPSRWVVVLHPRFGSAAELPADAKLYRRA